ncbi:hypothetical protein QFC20_002887 [Naganishia adeliensis]|uniref:Uncharacterized protein n=1 Tax=Naganishia adeliensis TaxID=92952 RepID=A0ACC2WFP8_9TREE|nr:hypothetical protein QFC20_002887 [Naganishia adeliensis]
MPSKAPRTSTNTSTNITAPSVPSWPREAAPQAAVNRLIEWIGSSCDDLRHDSSLAATCRRWQETYPANPSTMLLHLEGAVPALKLLEEIRTSRPDHALPESAFDGLRRITETKSEAGGYHGVYGHYQYVMSVDGNGKHLFYAGKGAAKMGAIGLVSFTDKQKGVDRRIKDEYFNLRARIKKLGWLPKEGERPHIRKMIYPPKDGYWVVKEWFGLLLGAESLDLVKAAYGMRTEEVDAVRVLFQDRNGKRRQDSGMDDTTFGLMDALWRLVETITIILSGQATTDLPNGQQAAPGPSPFIDVAFYPTAAEHYAVVRETIRPNLTLTGCNVRTPLLEEHERYDSVAAWQVAVGIILAYRPSTVLGNASFQSRWPTPPSAVETLGFTSSRLKDQQLQALRSIWTSPRAPSTGPASPAFRPTPRERAPEAISLAFDSGTKDASICIEIGALGNDGFMRTDLRRFAVWIGDGKMQIQRVLARVRRDDQGDFPMSPADAKLFRRIGCFLRVAQYHLRVNNLFVLADGPFYDGDIALSSSPSSAIARYVASPPQPPVFRPAGQPQLVGMDVAWQRVHEAHDINKAELALRAYDKAYDAIIKPARFEPSVALPRLDNLSLQGTVADAVRGAHRRHEWLRIEVGDFSAATTALAANLRSLSISE